MIRIIILFSFFSPKKTTLYTFLVKTVAVPSDLCFSFFSYFFLFIQLFFFFLIIYCVPGITVSARDTVVNKTIPSSLEFYSLMRETEDLTGINDGG